MGVFERRRPKLRIWQEEDVRDYRGCLYASKIAISVKIDGFEERAEKVSLKIPVAFSYAKLSFDENGELKQVIDKKEFNVASTFAPTKGL